MTSGQEQILRKWVLPALLIGLAGIVLTFVHFNTLDEITLSGENELPVVMGVREGCFLCHSEMSGFSPSHDPRAIGCSSCHSGNPLTRDKDRAHEGMAKVPGNIANAARSCGRADCHHDLVGKVTGSLMASGQGMVSVNRYVFGQTYSPDGPGHMSNLSDSAADIHLRQLCVTCHLGFPKTRSAPVDEESRGGGCTACHIDYSESAKAAMADYHANDKLPPVHPELNISIGNDRCFGCHSRSARISLNYEGWHETMLKSKNLKPPHEYRILQDSRVLEFKGADVHHTGKLLCIDCHTARDAMGDGNAYNHQGEQVEISCIDCHRNSPGEFLAYDQLDADSIKILELRKVVNRKTDRYLVSHRSGKPLINLTLGEDGSLQFRNKLDNQAAELKPPAEFCFAIDGHERLTCQSCHTRWAPACIECHTQYLPDRKRKDHYTGEKVQGVWKEYKNDLRDIPPALGIRREKRTGRDVVDTFIPGMILTIGGIRDNKPDRSAPARKDTDRFQVFRRMFSPTFSHTIRTESHSCQSCHQNPWMAGLGAGRIEYSTARSLKAPVPMRFFPDGSKHEADGLPRDAWTSFLKTRTRHTSTRVGARPFNAEEQYRILRVGYCLNCHEPEMPAGGKLYLHFERALDNRTASCLKAP